jgi:hypothetical protein
MRLSDDDNALLNQLDPKLLWRDWVCGVCRHYSEDRCRIWIDEPFLTSADAGACSDGFELADWVRRAREAELDSMEV